MRVCKDCGQECYSGASIRCMNCKIALRIKTQRLNKMKYQYHKQPKARYGVYQRGAERRGIEFKLSIADFQVFWQKPCYYCGDPIDTIGIDRLNNDKGYTVDNTVSCCKVCNFMKHTMDELQFIAK